MGGAEIRGQRTDVSGQKAEVSRLHRDYGEQRRQRTEVRGHKSQVGERNQRFRGRFRSLRSRRVVAARSSSPLATSIMNFSHSSVANLASRKRSFCSKNTRQAASAVRLLPSTNG